MSATSYVVPHAPHVTATIAPRVWNSALGKHDPQRVVMSCRVCGAVWQVDCEQGRPREHVHTFARVHLHADPLKAYKP